jgi:hypothetical protein
MPHTLRSRRLHRSGSAAFGLIGLLIVVAIILYLMFGVGGKGYMQGVQKTRESGKQLGQEINTRSLVDTIVAHQVATGELPADVEELEAGAAFMDSWGTQLRFEYEDERATPIVVIITSAGPDREFGTDDDIVVRERLPI